MTINPATFTLLFILFISLSMVSLSLLLLSLTPLGQILVKYRSILFSFALGCLITYAIALIGVFIEPLWIDNGSQETIVFPAHFGFALFTAPLFQLLIIPAVFIGIKIIRQLKQL